MPLARSHIILNFPPYSTRKKIPLTVFSRTTTFWIRLPRELYNLNLSSQGSVFIYQPYLYIHLQPPLSLISHTSFIIAILTVTVCLDWFSSLAFGHFNIKRYIANETGPYRQRRIIFSFVFQVIKIFSAFRHLETLHSKSRPLLEALAPPTAHIVGKYAAISPTRQEICKFNANFSDLQLQSDSIRRKRFALFLFQ